LQWLRTVRTFSKENIMKTKQIVQQIALVLTVCVATSAQAQLLGRGGLMGGGSGSIGGQLGMGSMGPGSIQRVDRLSRGADTESLRRSADARSNAGGSAAGSAALLPHLPAANSQAGGSGGGTLVGALGGSRDAVQPPTSESPGNSGLRGAVTGLAGASGDMAATPAIPNVRGDRDSSGGATGGLTAGRSGTLPAVPSNAAGAGNASGSGDGSASAGHANTSGNGQAGGGASAGFDGSAIAGRAQGAAAGARDQARAFAQPAGQAARSQVRDTGAYAQTSASNARGAARGTVQGAPGTGRDAAGALGSAARGASVNAQMDGSAGASAKR
jgi:hypothetical protein